MARITYEDDFKDKIVGATKKIIGIGALAFALAGCQTTPDNNLEVENLTNNTKVEAPVFESKIAAAAEKLETINHTNYKEIILDRKSGVYRHPIYPDKISTILFADDPNANETIKDQMEKLNLDPVWYEREQSLLDVVSFGSNGSRHVQNPLSPENEDVNLSRIKIAGKIEDVFLDLDSSVLKDHSKLPEGYQIEKLNHSLHNAFRLIRHEEGHSKIGQQMSTFDFIKGVVDLGVYAFLENDTETYAMIETAKLMNEEGYGHSEILAKAQDSITSSSSDLENEYKRKNNDYHLYHSSLKVVYDIMENDMDYILNLSPTESDTFTTILAQEAMSMNYAEEFNNAELDKARESFSEDFIHNTLDVENNIDLDKILKQKEMIMSSDHFENAEKGVQKTMENNYIAFKTIAKNQKEDGEYNYDEIIREIMENINDNKLDLMKLIDHDKSMLQIDDYSRLFNKVFDRLEKESLPTPDKAKIVMDMRGEIENTELTQGSEVKQESKQKLKM